VNRESSIVNDLYEITPSKGVFSLSGLLSPIDNSRLPIPILGNKVDGIQYL